MSLLKTIINCSDSGLNRSLCVSILAHGLLWAVVPSDFVKLHPNAEILLEIEQSKVLDRFITVPVLDTVVRKATEAAEVTADVKPKPTKKTVKRRTKKRRAKKRRAKRRPVKKPQVNPRKQVKVSLASSADTSVKPAQEAVAQEEVAQEATVSPASSQPEQSEGSKASSGVAQAKTPTRRELKGILKGYWASVNQVMKVKRSYPRAARRLGLEGTVLLKLVVNRNGKIVSVTVARSSGHKQLDNAAVADVKKIRRVPELPSVLKRDSMTFHFPMDYVLQS